MKTLGVAFMDGEHALLLEIYRRLAAPLLCDRDVEAFATRFQELLEYAAVHFKHEEEVMRASGYPDYLIHRRAHEKLMRSGDDLMHTVKKRFENYDCFALILYIKSWLHNHVRDHDERLAEFLIALDDKPVDTMAYIIEAAVLSADHARA